MSAKKEKSRHDYKTRLGTNTIRYMNNLMIGKYKGHELVDRKIFLGLKPGNI